MPAQPLHQRLRFLPSPLLRTGLILLTVLFTSLMVAPPALALCDGWAQEGSTHRNAGNGCQYTCSGGGWSGPFACDGQGNGLFQGDPPATAEQAAAQAAALQSSLEAAQAVLAQQGSAVTAAFAAQTETQRLLEATRQQAMVEAQRQSQINIAVQTGATAAQLAAINQQAAALSQQVAAAQGTANGSQLVGSNTADALRIAAVGYAPDSSLAKGQVDLNALAPPQAQQSLNPSQASEPPVTPVKLLCGQSITENKEVCYRVEVGVTMATLVEKFAGRIDMSTATLSNNQGTTVAGTLPALASDPKITVGQIATYNPNELKLLEAKPEIAALQNAKIDLTDSCRTSDDSLDQNCVGQIQPQLATLNNQEQTLIKDACGTGSECLQALQDIKNTVNSQRDLAFTLANNSDNFLEKSRAIEQSIVVAQNKAADCSPNEPDCVEILQDLAQAEQKRVDFLNNYSFCADSKDNLQTCTEIVQQDFNNVALYYAEITLNKQFKTDLNTALNTVTTSVSIMEAACGDNSGQLSRRDISCDQAQTDLKSAQDKLQTLVTGDLTQLCPAGDEQCQTYVLKVQSSAQDLFAQQRDSILYSQEWDDVSDNYIRLLKLQNQFCIVEPDPDRCQDFSDQVDQYGTNFQDISQRLQSCQGEYCASLQAQHASSTQNLLSQAIVIDEVKALYDRAKTIADSDRDPDLLAANLTISKNECAQFADQQVVKNCQEAIQSAYDNSILPYFSTLQRSQQILTTVNEGLQKIDTARTAAIASIAWETSPLPAKAVQIIGKITEELNKVCGDNLPADIEVIPAICNGIEANPTIIAPTVENTKSPPNNTTIPNQPGGVNSLVTVTPDTDYLPLPAHTVSRDTSAVPPARPATIKLQLTDTTANTDNTDKPQQDAHVQNYTLNTIKEQAFLHAFILQEAQQTKSICDNFASQGRPEISDCQDNAELINRTTDNWQQWATNHPYCKNNKAECIEIYEQAEEEAFIAKANQAITTSQTGVAIDCQVYDKIAMYSQRNQCDRDKERLNQSGNSELSLLLETSPICQSDRTKCESLALSITEKPEVKETVSANKIQYSQLVYQEATLDYVNGCWNNTSLLLRYGSVHDCLVNMDIQFDIAYENMVQTLTEECPAYVHSTPKDASQRSAVCDEARTYYEDNMYQYAEIANKPVDEVFSFNEYRQARTEQWQDLAEKGNTIIDCVSRNFCLLYNSEHPTGLVTHLARLDRELNLTDAEINTLLGRKDRDDPWSGVITSGWYSDYIDYDALSQTSQVKLCVFNTNCDTVSVGERPGGGNFHVENSEDFEWEVVLDSHISKMRATNGYNPAWENGDIMSGNYEENMNAFVDFYLQNFAGGNEALRPDVELVWLYTFGGQRNQILTAMDATLILGGGFNKEQAQLISQVLYSTGDLSAQSFMNVQDNRSSLSDLISDSWYSFSHPRETITAMLQVGEDGFRTAALKYTAESLNLNDIMFGAAYNNQPLYGNSTRQVFPNELVVASNLYREVIDKDTLGATALLLLGQGTGNIIYNDCYQRIGGAVDAVNPLVNYDWDNPNCSTDEALALTAGSLSLANELVSLPTLAASSFRAFISPVSANPIVQKISDVLGGVIHYGQAPYLIGGTTQVGYSWFSEFLFEDVFENIGGQTASGFVANLGGQSGAQQLASFFGSQAGGYYAPGGLESDVGEFISTREMFDNRSLLTTSYSNINSFLSATSDWLTDRPTIPDSNSLTNFSWNSAQSQPQLALLNRSSDPESDLQTLIANKGQVAFSQLAPLAQQAGWQFVFENNGQSGYIIKPTDDVNGGDALPDLVGLFEIKNGQMLIVTQSIEFTVINNGGLFTPAIPKRLEIADLVTTQLPPGVVRPPAELADTGQSSSEVTPLQQESQAKFNPLALLGPGQTPVALLPATVPGNNEVNDPDGAANNLARDLLSNQVNLLPSDQPAIPLNAGSILSNQELQEMAQDLSLVFTEDQRVVSFQPDPYNPARVVRHTVATYRPVTLSNGQMGAEIIWNQNGQALANSHPQWSNYAGGVLALTGFNPRVVAQTPATTYADFSESDAVFAQAAKTINDDYPVQDLTALQAQIKESGIPVYASNARQVTEVSQQTLVERPLTHIENWARSIVQGVINELIPQPTGTVAQRDGSTNSATGGNANKAVDPLSQTQVIDVSALREELANESNNAAQTETPNTASNKRSQPSSNYISNSLGNLKELDGIFELIEEAERNRAAQLPNDATQELPVVEPTSDNADAPPPLDYQTPADEEVISTTPITETDTNDSNPPLLDTPALIPDEGIVPPPEQPPIQPPKPSTPPYVSQITQQTPQDDPQIHISDTYDLAQVSNRGAHYNKGVNQDGVVTFEFDENGQKVVVQAVIDGVGGKVNDQKAQSDRIAYEISEALMNGMRQGVPVETILRQVMQDANKNAGAVLVMSVIRDNIVDIYTIGDAQIVIFGQDGQLKFITPRETQAMVAQRNGQQVIVTHPVNSLVQGETPPLRKLSYVLTPGDVMVSMSDGFHDNVTLSEISQAIQKQGLEAAATNLRDLALTRMQQAYDKRPATVKNNESAFYSSENSNDYQPTLLTTEMIVEVTAPSEQRQNRHVYAVVKNNALNQALAKLPSNPLSRWMFNIMPPLRMEYVQPFGQSTRYNSVVRQVVYNSKIGKPDNVSFSVFHYKGQPESTTAPQTNVKQAPKEPAGLNSSFPLSVAEADTDVAVYEQNQEQYDGDNPPGTNRSSGIYNRYQKGITIFANLKYSIESLVQNDWLHAQSANNIFLKTLVAVRHQPFGVGRWKLSVDDVLIGVINQINNYNLSLHIQWYSQYFPHLRPEQIYTRLVENIWNMVIVHRPQEIVLQVYNPTTFEIYTHDEALRDAEAELSQHRQKIKGKIPSGQESLFYNDAQVRQQAFSLISQKIAQGGVLETRLQPTLRNGTNGKPNLGDPIVNSKEGVFTTNNVFITNEDYSATQFEADQKNWLVNMIMGSLPTLLNKAIITAQHVTETTGSASDAYGIFLANDGAYNNYSDVTIAIKSRDASGNPKITLYVFDAKKLSDLFKTDSLPNMRPPLLNALIDGQFTPLVKHVIEVDQGVWQKHTEIAKSGRLIEGVDTTFEDLDLNPDIIEDRRMLVYLNRIALLYETDVRTVGDARHKDDPSYGELGNHVYQTIHLIYWHDPKNNNKPFLELEARNPHNWQNGADAIFLHKTLVGLNLRANPPVPIQPIDPANLLKAESQQLNHERLLNSRATRLVAMENNQGQMDRKEKRLLAIQNTVKEAINNDPETMAKLDKHKLTPEDVVRVITLDLLIDNALMAKGDIHTMFFLDKVLGTSQIMTTLLNRGYTIDHLITLALNKRDTTNGRNISASLSIMAGRFEPYLQALTRILRLPSYHFYNAKLMDSTLPTTGVKVIQVNRYFHGEKVIDEAHARRLMEQEKQRQLQEIALHSTAHNYHTWQDWEIPIPGVGKIFKFFTRGRGVAVMAKNRTSVILLRDENGNTIDVAHPNEGRVFLHFDFNPDFWRGVADTRPYYKQLRPVIMAVRRVYPNFLRHMDENQAMYHFIQEMHQDPSALDRATDEQLEIFEKLWGLPAEETTE